MARSLANPVPPVLARLLSLLGRQRAQLAVELLDPVLHRGRLAMTEPDDQPADAAEHERHEQIEEVAHVTAPPPPRWAGRPCPMPSRPPTFPSSRWERRTS